MDSFYQRFIRDPSIPNLGAYLGFNDGESDDLANERALHFFQEQGVIPSELSSVQCQFQFEDGSRCGVRMKIRRDSTKKLGFRLMCNGDGHRHRKLTVCPLKGTLLDSKNLPPHKILRLLICFINRVSVSQAALDSKATHKIAVIWYKTFRVVTYTAAWHDYQPIGGPGQVVEVDESFLFDRKNHKGRVLPSSAHWTVGGIDRVTHKSFSLLTPDRSAGTLREILRRCILPGTHLVTDGWAGYNDCATELDLITHSVIIHQRNFIMPAPYEEPLWMSIECLDPNAADPNFIGPWPEGVVPFRVHTQTCERQWRSLKDTMCPGGYISEERLESYLGSWMYFQNILRPLRTPTEKLLRFISDVRRLYPGTTGIPISDRLEDICHCPSCATTA